VKMTYILIFIISKKIKVPTKDIASKLRFSIVTTSKMHDNCQTTSEITNLRKQNSEGVGSIS
jgi:Mn-dependent DtxR family transcriptional regulator